MLIKQLLWRNGAQHSPPESPPLAHQHPAALLLRFVSSQHLSPSSSMLTLFCISHHPLYAPFSLFVIFLPSKHFLPKPQHPVYLCRGHAAPHLPPHAGPSPRERLTIPSASLLICHPNGGYEGEKQQFAEGETAAEVFGLLISGSGSDPRYVYSHTHWQQPFFRTF